jgi:hypothetical protein
VRAYVRAFERAWHSLHVCVCREQLLAAARTRVGARYDVFRTCAPDGDKAAAAAAAAAAAGVFTAETPAATLLTHADIRKFAEQNPDMVCGGSVLARACVQINTRVVTGERTQ